MTLEELNPKGHELPETVLNNLLDLLDRINELDKYCPYDLIPTPGRSGYRTDEEQMLVNPKNPKSNHVMGLAVDIYDGDMIIFEWCENNLAILVRVGLWLENPRADMDQHLHIQSVPPRSGNRIFWP